MTERPVFIETAVFAAAAGISLRNAQKALKRAFEGKSWNKHHLEVRAIGGRGGQAGTNYQVGLHTLPKEIADRVAAPTQHKLPLKDLSAPSKNWKERLVLAAIAAGPTKSAARGAKISELAASCEHQTGKKAGQPIAAKTLRGWVAAYEAKGTTALLRRRRADKGKDRTVVWRTLDKAMAEAGISPERQDKAKADIVLEVKTLLLSGAGTVSNVNMLAQPKLRDIVLAEIPNIERQTLDRICRIPSGFVRRYYRLRQSHQKRTDAKSFSDKKTCRIRRHRDGMKPMQMVAFDVRHSDIMYRRLSDGSLATVKMIVALDIANNRAFSRVFLMEKGEAISRKHVLMFIRDLFSDPSWGIPLAIYLDNGSEFKIGEAADELAAIAQFVRDTRAIELGIFDAALLDKPGVLHAQPYNGQSKFIEGLFSNFTRSIEPMYPGFVGGNRQAKKVENQGKEKKPLPGNEAELKVKYAQMVDYYNAKQQQRGTIRKKTPNDVFSRQVEEGWQPIVYDPAEFALAFGNTEYRKVHTGGEFQFDGQVYWHDDLAIREGERICIRVPILDAGGRIPVLSDKGKVLCVASLAPSFGVGEVAGAREKGRRNGVLQKQMAEEAAGVPVVDLSPRIDRAIAELPKPPIPTPLATVSIDPALRAASVQQLHTDAMPSKRSALAKNELFLQQANEALRRAG